MSNSTEQNKKNTDKKFSINKVIQFLDKDNNMIVFIVTMALLIPIIVKLGIGLCPWGEEGNATWLLFWATWLGSIVGGIITILGVYITLQENKNQLKNTLNADRERYENDRRLSLMPHLKMINDTINEHVDKYIYFNKNPKYSPTIIIKNIGIGSALNITLTINEHVGKLDMSKESTFKFDLGVNESICIELNFKIANSVNSNFKLEYNDILGKYKYKQIGQITMRDGYNAEIIMMRKDPDEIK